MLFDTYGPGNPLIVAELSCNHSGSKDMLMRLIAEAAKAGADAVKFQAYEPDDMTIPGFKLKGTAWQGTDLYELYEKARTPLEWLPDAYELAREHDLIPFASVFHPDKVPFLEDLGTELYKIASPEAGWRRLIQAVVDTCKPVLISDGVLGKKTPFCVAGDGPEYMIRLRCVSKYPADLGSYGLSDRHGHPGPWGLSDHTRHRILWTTAAALGASVIEAHLMARPDHYDEMGLPQPLDSGHSLVPFEFELNAEDARAAARITHTYPPEPEDIEFQRRWLYARDLPAGHPIDPDEDLVCLRAPEGLPANEGLWESASVSGFRLKHAVKKHAPVAGTKLHVPIPGVGR